MKTGEESTEENDLPSPAENVLSELIAGLLVPAFSTWRTIDEIHEKIAEA